MPLKLGNKGFVLGGVGNDATGQRLPRRSLPVPAYESLTSITHRPFSRNVGQI
jgi:hypothetical protein